jgi:hypothetical protein
VPNPDEYTRLQVVNPKAMPSEWLALDLGLGEIAPMALALENPTRLARSLCRFARSGAFTAQGDPRQIELS